LGLNDLLEFVSSFAKSTQFAFYKSDARNQIDKLISENISNIKMKTEYESDLENVYKNIQNYFNENDDINVKKIEEKIKEYNNKKETINNEIVRLSNLNLPKINLREIKSKFLILIHHQNL
jgi:molecular chaperone DnaK (HSP70)